MTSLYRWHTHLVLMYVQYRDHGAKPLPDSRGRTVYMNNPSAHRKSRKQKKNRKKKRFTVNASFTINTQENACLLLLLLLLLPFPRQYTYQHGTKARPSAPQDRPHGPSAQRDRQPDISTTEANRSISTSLNTPAESLLTSSAKHAPPTAQRVNEKNARTYQVVGSTADPYRLRPGAKGMGERLAILKNTETVLACSNRFVHFYNRVCMYNVQRHFQHSSGHETQTNQT